MQQLYQKLSKYTLQDAIQIEGTDRQFLSLQKLSKNINNNDNYLLLVIANSLICYQLSGKGEEYWEEFSEYFMNSKLDKNNIIDELIIFLKQSQNNKRFTNIKIKRLEKLRSFVYEFDGLGEYYYNNMILLRDELSKHMNQNKEAKTIVFAIKIFGYFARNIFDFVEFPKQIHIPIDSRLTNLFEKYGGEYDNINNFYLELSEKLNIPMLHLDGIIWTLYDKLMNNEKM